MDNFASIILNEKDFKKKLGIMYMLQRRSDIFFDNSVIFKATLVKLFLEQTDLPMDENLIITACLLCSCKKKTNKQVSGVEDNTESASYLTKLGFPKRFCKICEEYNNRNGNLPREKESDILELVDIFGDLLLDSPERKGLTVDEALVLLSERYFKDKDNIYLKQFKDFVIRMEEIKI